MTKSNLTGSLKKTISYYYLLSFCPPEKIKDFKGSMVAMRKALAESAGMSEADCFAQALPEVCRRIVSFQQATRVPDPQAVASLEAAARDADKNASAAAAFQQQIAQIAALPGRARPENRLHRNKGCKLCKTACQYGYFTLVSDPQFSVLQEAMQAEIARPAGRQSPLLPLYGFALNHITQLAGVKEVFIQSEQLVNLSFCLLLLGMAKSRLALPEAQLTLLQAANREFIRRQTI
jgi:hypothetical protein